MPEVGDFEIVGKALKAVAQVLMRLLRERSDCLRSADPGPRQVLCWGIKSEHSVI